MKRAYRLGTGCAASPLSRTLGRSARKEEAAFPRRRPLWFRASASRQPIFKTPERDHQIRKANCVQAKLEMDVAALDISELMHALSKACQIAFKRLGCSSAQNTDERRDLLLCVSQDRPSRCRTADEREKFTPPHGPYPKAKDHGKYSRSGVFAVEKAPIHVRFGSLADIAISSHNVRFTPDNGHGSARF